MPDAQELQSVVDAAEQAAAAGDYASAERLLRDVASLQEASLGPLHPDLANTLNNLGVVCEITEKPADAEQFFRRSCAIAAAAPRPIIRSSPRAARTSRSSVPREASPSTFPSRRHNPGSRSWSRSSPTSSR